MYETPALTELQGRSDVYWMGALSALAQAPEVDAEDTSDRLAEPVSFVMPYRAAYRRYLDHLETCTTCSQGSFLDQCPEGDRRSAEAADAMVRQGTGSGRN